MGDRLVDRFTLLHFVVGLVISLFQIPILWFIGAIVLFEIWENSKDGMKSLNTWKPYKLFGGKPKKDTIANSISDIVFAIFGHFVGSLIRKKFPLNPIVVDAS